jgi:hypothetical protein
MCHSVNHFRFPKEDHLPDWVRRDKHGNEGDRAEFFLCILFHSVEFLADSVIKILKTNLFSTDWTFLSGPTGKEEIYQHFL